MTGDPHDAFWAGVPGPDTTSTRSRHAETLTLDHWASSKDDFCSRVAGRKSTLKIVLKTKDDPYFLESWIHHHAKIVGLGDLIILDNMSSSESVRRTYEKYQSRIPIVQFEGDHELWHVPAERPELYECLRQSSQFHVFLDTDEFLVLLDKQTYACDERIAELLQTHADTDVFPASWLLNEVGCDRRFELGESLYALGHRLLWGKPVIRSNATVLAADRCHNLYIDKSLFRAPVMTRLFVLHMVNLFPQQRIEVNIRKLVAAGFASVDDTLESILMKDVNSIVDARGRALKKWVGELRDLATRSRVSEPPSDVLGRGGLELTEDGQIRFYSDAEARIIEEFIDGSSGFSSAVLQTEQHELRTCSADELKRKWGLMSGTGVEQIPETRT